MTADAGGVGAPRFDVVLRGYDRRQVDEHVARLQRVVSRMRADLEMVRSQPFPVVQAPPPGFGGPGPGRPPGPSPRPRPDEPDMIGSFTDRMQSILQAAEEEAAEIRNKARAGARAEADSVRAEVADLVRQRDAVLAELTRLRGQLQGMLGGPTAQMTAAPRGGGPGGPPPAAGPAASGPGQPPGAERPASAGGPPRPRPSPSPTGPPKAAGQQAGAAQPGVPQPASAQANQPRPGATTPVAPRPGPPSPQQQATTQQPTSKAPQSNAASISPQPKPAQSNPASNPAQPNPGPSNSPQSKPPLPKPSQAGQPSSPPSTVRNAPAAGGEAGQNGAPSKGSNGSVPQNGATRGAAADPAPSAGRPGDSRPPVPEAGKAAHRLPTGAYPVAGEHPSMRPRSEPEPEPGDLFRPAAPQGRDAKPVEKPGPPVRKPGDVEATVKVGLVRPVAAPSDRTVLSPAVPPAEKKDAGKDAPSDAKRSDSDGSAGPGHPDRSTSTSRSG